MEELCGRLRAAKETLEAHKAPTELTTAVDEAIEILMADAPAPEKQPSAKASEKAARPDS